MRRFDSTFTSTWSAVRGHRFTKLARTAGNVWLLAATLTAGIPQPANAAGTFISAPNRLDMVHDAARDVLYISSGSTVLRYHLGSSAFLSPFQLTGSLGGMDLSPDGNTLAIADRTRSGSNVWIHLVDLTGETSQRAFFPRAFGEGGTYTLAYGSDGAILVSGTYEGSGWVPLRRYDPVTEEVREIASIRQSSMLAASGDRNTIAYEESNISNGPVGRYDVASQTIVRSGGTGWFNYEVGANKDGTQIAAPTYDGTYIFDEFFNVVTNVGDYAADQPIGVAYHPTKDAVFFAWAGTTAVRVHDTASFSVVGSFDTGYSFSAPGNAAFVHGRIKLSRDGTLVFVTVGNGIRYFTNNLVIPQYFRFIVEGNPARLGTPVPHAYGTNFINAGTVVTNSVGPQSEAAGVRYRAAGATVSGIVPRAVSDTSITLVLSNAARLTWNWTPIAYLLTATVAGPGTINSGGGWFATNAVTSLTATPNAGARFVRWVGDVPSSQVADLTISLSMDRVRRVTALFAPDTGGGFSLNGDWPTFGRGPAHTGYLPGVLGDGSFRLRWTATIGGNLQQPAVAGGRVFVTPKQYFGNGFLTAVHEYSGKNLWWYTFNSAFSINPPSYDNGAVFVQRGNHGSDTHLWSFDAATGGTNWVSPHSAQWESYMAPTIGGGSVYVNGGYYGGIYGFNETSGAQKFFLELEQYDGWTPLYYGGRLFSWVEGKFREHDLNTGAVLWTYNAGWSWAGWTMDRTIAADAGRAFVFGNPNLYAIDLSTHQAAWRVDGTFIGTPAVANGIVYSMTSTGVNAYAALDGQLLGSYPISSPFYQPIVTDDVLIAASRTETKVFDLASFTPRQTLLVGGYVSLANGVLYVATSGGEVQAFSAGPDAQLVVRSGDVQRGNPFPFIYGTNYVSLGSMITPAIDAAVPGAPGTRYFVAGWTGTGSVPVSGAGNSVTFALTADSSITWLWKTQHFLATAVNSNGTLNVASGWYDAGSTVSITATPSNYFHFTGWSGDATGTGPSINVTMNGPRSVTALFAPDLVTNGVPRWWLAQFGFTTDDAGALLDGDGDHLPNWREFTLGTNPLQRDTDGDTYDDDEELAWASNPTSAVSRPLVPLVIVGSPANYGAPSPLGYGTNMVLLRRGVTNAVSTPIAGPAGVRHVATGWSGSGDVPAAGATNSIVFILRTNSTLTWNWQRQYFLDVDVVSNGTVNIADSWLAENTAVTLTAMPDPYFGFDHWAGSVSTAVNPLSLSLTSPMTLVAHFVPLLVANGTPQWWLAANGLPVSDAGALADTDNDTLPNWREYQLNTNPNLRDTDGDGYDDGLEVARNSLPTDPASVPRVTLVIGGNPIAVGTPQPYPYGTYSVPLFTVLTSTVPSIVPQGNGVRQVSTGWSGTGDVPDAGSGNSVSFTLSNNSALTWNWSTEYALVTSTNFSLTPGAPAQSELASLLANGTVSNDAFGWRVALDGDLAVVGAPFNGTNTPNFSPFGAAYVFRRSGTNWAFESRLLPDNAPIGFYGSAVSVRGDRIAVGALLVSTPTVQCAVYLFRRVNNVWIRETTINTGQPASSWDEWSVHLSDNLLAVGTSGDPSRATLGGAVVLYRFFGSQWGQETKITPGDYKAYQRFGAAVALSGTNLLLVGAPGDTVGRSYAGAAYVYRRVGQSWVQDAKFAPPQVARFAEFGSAVALARDYALIGAPFDEEADVPVGTAFLFRYVNGGWTNVVRLRAPEPEAYQQFGSAVALTTNQALVGAAHAHGATPESGAGYLFRRFDQSWLPISTLRAARGESEDDFGRAVALSDSFALVGAPNADALALDAGAAYVFETGVVSENGATSWWTTGAMATPPTAPLTLSLSNVTYRFTGWQLDGTRLLLPDGTPSNPPDRIVMSAPHILVANYLPQDADADGDGLPDWWEVFFLGTTAFASSADADGDGASNWQEWLAGTNPGRAASVLRASGQWVTEGGVNRFVVRWPAAAGRTYRVFGSTSLPGGFSIIATNLAATPPLNSYADGDRGAGRAFYYIEVESVTP